MWNIPGKLAGQLLDDAAEIQLDMPHLSGDVSVLVSISQDLFSINFDNIRVLYGGEAFTRFKGGRYVLRDLDGYVPTQYAALERYWNKLRRDECRLSCQTLDVIRNGYLQYKENLECAANPWLAKAEIKLSVFGINLMAGMLMTFEGSLRAEAGDIREECATYQDAKEIITHGNEFFIKILRDAEGELPPANMSQLEACIDMGERITSTYDDLVANCGKMLLEYERTKMLMR